MQNEELRSYDFDFAGGSDNRYNFRTTNDISYNVRFKPGADYIPAQEHWRDDLFELVIELISAPDLNRVPNDPAVAATIFHIISDFFTVHQRVILYICDDSDSRELARKRKFDNWFSRFGNHLFEKHDLPTVADGPERYFASIFFRSDNPNRSAIITAFDRLASGDK